MNDRLDYVSVETQKDAEELVQKLVTKIQLIYDENDNLNKEFSILASRLDTTKEKSYL